jgi:ABC-type lipoprotein release transport system permease subunit
LLALFAGQRRETPWAVTFGFEMFVACRYLRTRRKEKVISVIAVLAVIGMAASVMALVISLALNNAFQNPVTWIIVGLIEMVGALSILGTLSRIVLAKQRDIAALLSMGARRLQIQRIFAIQGAIIGAMGTAIGLALGYGVCDLADRLIRLDEAGYGMGIVPLNPRPIDGVWIAGAALGVSLIATLYPARMAARITPVDVLRHK